jgi:hypothetical protein
VKILIQKRKSRKSAGNADLHPKKKKSSGNADLHPTESGADLHPKKQNPKNQNPQVTHIFIQQSPVNNFRAVHLLAHSPTVWPFVANGSAEQDLMRKFETFLANKTLENKSLENKSVGNKSLEGISGDGFGGASFGGNQSFGGDSFGGNQTFGGNQSFGGEVNRTDVFASSDGFGRNALSCLKWRLKHLFSLKFPDMVAVESVAVWER